MNKTEIISQRAAVKAWIIENYFIFAMNIVILLISKIFLYKYDSQIFIWEFQPFVAKISFRWNFRLCNIFNIFWWPCKFYTIYIIFLSSSKFHTIYIYPLYYQLLSSATINYYQLLSKIIDIARSSKFETFLLNDLIALHERSVEGSSPLKIFKNKYECWKMIQY